MESAILPIPHSQPRLQIKVNIQQLGEAEANAKCQILQNAIQEIYRKNSSLLSFEELYRIAYELVLYKRGDILYSGLQQAVSHHAFCKIKNDLKNAVHNGFLKQVLSAWNDNQISLLIIRDTLMYLDRVYVAQTNCMDVYSLGLKMFHEVIISDPRVCVQLSRELLNAVAEERRGAITDRSAIRNACSMLLDLGLGSRKVYETIFEQPFIASTEEYYRIESETRLMQRNAVDYIRQVDRWLQEETERATQCFDKTTGLAVNRAIEREAIRKHMRALLEMEGSGVLAMIKCRRLDDLSVMYRLISRVDAAPMYSCISEYLRSIGKSLVSEHASSLNPVNYIQNLLKLKDEFDTILYESFGGDQSFRQMVWSNFEYFINRNNRSPEFLSLFIDDQLRRGIHGMSEQEMELVLDRSIILFKFLQEKDVFERYYKQHLARRLLLNRCISDDTEKNMISKLKVECGSQFTFKMEHMFKDMALSDTMNDEFKSYIDNNLSVHYNIELSVRVLTTGFWPISPSPIRCQIPAEPLALYEEFEKFYLAKHSGRQLTLQTYHGTADLYAYFYPTPLDHTASTNTDAEESAAIGAAASGLTAAARPIASRPTASRLAAVWFIASESAASGPTAAARPAAAGSGHTIVGDEAKVFRKHILIVSTAQMSLLVLFNRKDSWTYEELQMETEIPDRELLRALQSLAMGRIGQRVLTKEPKSLIIERDNSFSVNDNFTSKLFRVRIQNVAAKGETEAERIETRCRVDDERKHEVEAAIVRIMKARRVLKHNTLIAEVTQQLKRRFLPCPQFIERRIEGLIQREYLARSKGDQKVYTYSA